MTLTPTSMTAFQPSNDLLIRKGYFEPLFLIREHLTAVTACELITISNGQAVGDRVYLLTGDVAGFLIIYALREQRKLVELKFNDGILCIRGFEDDLCILVHCRDGKVYSFSMHQLESPTVIPVLTCGGHTFCQMDVVKHKGQKLALLPSLKTIDGVDIWNVSTRKILIDGIQPKDEKSGNVMCAKFAKKSNEELSILVGTDDGVLRSYRLDLFGLKDEYKTEESSRLKLVKQTVTCISYDQSNDSLAVGGPHMDLVFVKNALQSDHCTILRTQVCTEGFSDAATSQDLLITGGWDGKIRFFNTEDLSLLALSNLHSDTILSLRIFKLANGLRDLKRPSIKHDNLMIVTSQDKLVSVFSLSPIHQLKDQRVG